jgi:hypothetical protein
MDGDEGRIRLVNGDDERRRRVTVFFRLLLAIPQYVWWLVWGLGIVIVLPVHWLLTLVGGQPVASLHAFYSQYVRFSVHLYAYVFLAAERWPPFLGEARMYEIDLETPESPLRQSRWSVLLRFPIALPALILSLALVGVGSGGGGDVTTTSSDGDAAATAGGFGPGVVYVLGFLAWFAALALARTPRGLRDAIAYCVGYAAQAWGYLLLVTDRYPTTDPTGVPRAPMPPHPVEVHNDEDRRRNRLMVLFRIPLAFPHLVWVTLWSVVALVVAVAGWFITLAVGRLPAPLHGFLASFVRYGAHVNAFLSVLGGPFPGFTGRPGAYPVDVVVAGPERQSRWKTLFRLLLAIPALLISSAFSTVQLLAAVGAWWAALVIGRVPLGLHRLLAWLVRYQAQVGAYLLLVTDRYPYTGPNGPGVQEDWMRTPEAP